MIHRAREQPKAFTLIELLVVIAVIAILAAMLLSAFSKGKAQAQSAQCKSNLHQLSLALNLYTSDNRKYPFFFQSEPPTDDYYIWWDNMILPYAGKSQAVYTCPANQSPQTWTNIQGWILYYGAYDNGLELAPNPSYGYNFAGSGSYSNALEPNLARGQPLSLGLGGLPFSGPAVAESQVLAPHDMVAMADWTNFPAGDDHDLDDWINLLTQMLPTRHDKGVNGAFCDGHVEYRKYTVWAQRTAAARQCWNNDHQPHPETWIYDP